CEVGNDLFSHLILEEIERAGISQDFVVVRDYPLRAVSVSMAYQGERGFVSYADVHAEKIRHMFDVQAADREVDRVQDADMLARSLHDMLERYEFDAAFLYATHTMLPLVEMLAQRRQFPIFLDDGWHAETLSQAHILSMLRSVTYFMPNQSEAIAMTGASNAQEAAARLAQMTPTAIVKDGPRGVIACQQGQMLACPALPIDRVVDTTGAGDAFNGGFIYGILRGYSLPDALRCGTICGSLSTTALGGATAVPTAGELERIRGTM
ncbi:MAG TPA: PfkB family carbohydrate kinase, partial [Chthonomonadales bacterium]|nr:PfkB family carbohydrate kinase [Chthonomonadales bacterium]